MYSSTDLLLALDYGGTKLTAAILAIGGEAKTKDEVYARGWRDNRRTYSPAHPDANYDLRTMREMAANLLAGQTPALVGVSFGGPVDSANGIVRLSHHVAGWEDIRLADLLEAEYHAPVAVDNDANVAALGEFHFGAGENCDSLFYITVSTGVGGGWILNGSPWQGAEGMAGEIGHTVVDPQGPPCLCGKKGCVERLASGPYMAEDARAKIRMALQGTSAPTLPDEQGGILLGIVNHDLDRISGKTISQAADQGDRLAWEILARSAWALGVGIGNAANLVNPQRFVLGGGVINAGEWYLERVQKSARHTALPEIHFDIVAAKLGDDAPLWGAAALALEQNPGFAPWWVK